MEFLYKMYNHPNFGLYLFTTITILAVLFVIVLLLALKDAKKVENLEEKKKEEQESAKESNTEFKETINNNLDNYAFTEDTPSTALETPVKEDNFVSSTVDEPNFESPNNVFEPVEPEKDFTSSSDDFRITDDYSDFSFESSPNVDEEDAFKTSIIEGINTESLSGQTFSDTPSLNPIEPPEIADVFAEVNSYEPVSKFKAIREEFKPIEADENDYAVEQPKETKSYPSQFSSVYVDRKEEVGLPKKAEEPVKIPMPKEEAPAPTELPKVRHIPTPKPIQLGVNKPINNLDSVEKETYNIK